jgi:hypothetical protein
MLRARRARIDFSLQPLKKETIMFKIAMGATVQISPNESGKVIGRAEYNDNTLHTYLVRYVAGDGCLVENWWKEDAITAVA